MRARSFVTPALATALCAGCTATGVHRTHSLRLHGGTHLPAEDAVEDLSTGTGSNTTWGLEYVYAPARKKLGFEVGAFQSFTDGDGTNTLPGLGLGEAEVEKKFNEMHAGLHYPFATVGAVEAEFGLGLAYIDATVDTKIAGGSELSFQDEGLGAYAKLAGTVPISDSVGVGLDLRFVGPFEDFRDEQDGLTYDANLRQLQATLYLALSW